MNCSTFQSAALYPDTVVRAGTWYTECQLRAWREVDTGRACEPQSPVLHSPITSLAMYRIDSISSVKLSILLIVAVECVLVTARYPSPLAQRRVGHPRDSNRGGVNNRTHTSYHVLSRWHPRSCHYMRRIPYKQPYTSLRLLSIISKQQHTTVKMSDNKGEEQREFCSIAGLLPLGFKHCHLIT